MASASQVVEFVRALALGWKNLAAYPPGHPVLVSSLDLIQRRLAELRGPAGEIVLGIARDGVLYGTDKIDSTYAQKFGNALFTRGVATLRFDMTTDPAAIETFLRLLGGGTAAEPARPIWEELTAAGIMSIHLQAVDYSDVRVTDDLESGPLRSDNEDLWEQIVRAIIEGRELSPEGKRLLGHRVKSASELATLILQYAQSIEQGAEFDPDATFGVKFTYRVDGQNTAHDLGGRIAETVGSFISSSAGTRKEAGVQQAIELLKALPDPMRAAVTRSVLRALAADESAGTLLRDFAAHLHADEVLETMRYLSDEVKLSTHAMRLVEALMATSKATSEAANASTSIVADVVHLYGEDDIDQYNPDDHRQLLDQVSVHVPEARGSAIRPISDLGERIDTIAPDAVSHQVANTLLALLRAQGPRRPPWSVLQRVEAVFLADINASRFGQALEIITELQELAIVADNPALQDAIHQSFDRMGTADTIRIVIDSLHRASPNDAKVLTKLLEILGTAATKNLLLMLAEETNRSRRRRLFDFVTSLGPVIIPEIKPFLADNRWFVVRNMIALVRGIGDQSLLPEVRRCAAHPDLRVRLEAIRALLALEPTPPRGLLEDAIRDPDPKVAEKAITLVGSYGIKEAVDPLLQIVDGNDVWGARRPLRLLALRALGELAEPRALPRLERFFTNSFLPWPAKEERRVAYESLAGYPAGERAPIVARGLRSRDPYVREVCEKLTATA